MYTILAKKFHVNFYVPCSYEQYVLVFHLLQKEKPGATQLNLEEYISRSKQTMDTILCKEFHINFYVSRSYEQYVLVFHP